jgi:hypothetical protein
VVERAGRGWCVAGASMPCRVTCSAQGKRCVHASERLCRSRRPEHAQEGAERGLESGQRVAWAVASHWVSTTAARGLWWRGSRGWLDFCALVSMSVRWVASGFEREEW